MSKNYIATIKAALGPERAMVFMETVAALDLNPDDPELVLAAANASIVISLAEIPKQIVAERERFESVAARFLIDADLAVAKAFVKSSDEMQTEVRTMARELALGEYSAAAALRSTAINDEVRALRGATAELERERQAVDARQIANGGPAPLEMAGAGQGRSLPPSGASLTPKLALLIAAAVVIGVLLGAWMTKRTYEGWRPPVHTSPRA